MTMCAPIALAVGELTCLLHSRLLFIAPVAARLFSFRVGLTAGCGPAIHTVCVQNVGGKNQNGCRFNFLLLTSVRSHVILEKMLFPLHALLTLNCCYQCKIFSLGGNLYPTYHKCIGWVSFSWGLHALYLFFLEKVF